MTLLDLIDILILGCVASLIFLFGMVIGVLIMKGRRRRVRGT